MYSANDAPLSKWGFYVAVVVALLGPFQFGIGISSLNTVVDTVSEDLGFEKNVGGAVASAMFFLGAVVGGLISAPLEMASGKYTQSSIGLLLTIGNLLCACTTRNKICWGGPAHGCVAAMLASGRLFSGIGAGAARVISPKYLARIAPPNIRGALLACTPFGIAFGLFGAILMGLPYEIDDEYELGWEWWRTMFLISSVPAILQTVLGLPMSDFVQLGRKLLDGGRRGATDTVEGETVTAQIPILSQENRSDRDTESAPAPQGVTSIAEAPIQEHPNMRESLRLCFHRRYRRAILLGLGVPVLGNLCGINVMISYSSTAFKNANVDSPILSSILVGFAAIVGVAITVLAVDRAGRRKMARISYAGGTIFYVGIALSAVLPSSVSGYFAVVFYVGHTVAVGLACAPLTVCYAPEVVPSEIAPVILGLGSALALLTSFFLLLIFPALLDAIGTLWMFMIFALISFFAQIFMAVYMVETKGRELKDFMAEIQKIRN